MLDGQFNLDGYTFGHPQDPCVVLTDGWDTSGYEIRDQDKPMPFSDSLAFGRDVFSPGVWTFTIGVRDPLGGDVFRHLQELAVAWRGENVRHTPGAVSTLRYRRHGEERIVYGRPRRFVVEKDDVWDDEWKLVTCTFQLMDPLTYSSTLNELVLDLVNTSKSTGLIFPTSFPWSFGRSGNIREGVVNLDAVVPAPFQVHIRGPVTGQASNFKLSGKGWSMVFNTTLSPTGNIIVDTSSGIVKRNSVPFGAGSAVSNYRHKLQPGPQEIVFSADDPSYSTTATIRWRNVSPIY